MTKKILMALLFIVGCSTMFVSCSDNEETISQSKATFAVNVPADLTDATLQKYRANSCECANRSKDCFEHFHTKGNQ